MTGGVRADPELGRASLAGVPALLGSAEAPVVLAAPAGPGPVLLEGDRVAIVGAERSGGFDVRIDGRLVACELGTDAGSAANVLVGPATMRRELPGTRASTLETALALPALPLAAVQWTSPPGAPTAGTLTLELSLLRGEGSVRYRADETGVRAAAEGDGTVVDALVHPAPSEWSVRPHERGGVRVRAVVDRSGPVTLLVAAGTPAAVERALAAAPHLASHEIRAAAAADPDRCRGLAVRTGVRELDHGVVWAAARLHAALRRTGTAAPDDLFWSGVGALAAGDHEGAERALEGLDAGDPLGTLLAARLALATGEQGPALARRALLSAERIEAFRRSGAQEWAVWSAALRLLADGLRHAAPEAELQELRRMAAEPPPAGGRGVRLPMAGTPGPGGASWPGWLLRAGTTAPDTAPPPGLAAWAALSRGDAEAGYASWRRRLAEGVGGGPAGRGSWDPAPEPWAPGAPGAGMLLATLAHGLLGIEPDAPSGRIGLAPLFPRNMEAFAVERIRVGDAEMSLSYRRDPPLHRFRIEPLGGRVPVTAVFEPSVPAGSVLETRVDGAAADLERRSTGNRTRVRVQLPLDALRTLDIVEKE